MSLLSLRRWEGLELSMEEVVVVLGPPSVWFPGIWGGCSPVPLVLLVLSSVLELLSPSRRLERVPSSCARAGDMGQCSERGWLCVPA